MKKLPQKSMVKAELTFGQPIFERFHETYADLLRRAKEGTRDGYPTSSGLDGSATHANAYSDPVGELATQDPMADPVRAAVLRVFTAWREVVNNLEIMGMAMARCEPDDPERAKPDTNFIRGACLNCERIVYVGEKFRASRCDACYSYRRRHNGTEERPIEDIEVA